jgi:hypothetical protein
MMTTGEEVCSRSHPSCVACRQQRTHLPPQPALVSPSALSQRVEPVLLRSLYTCIPTLDDPETTPLSLVPACEKASFFAREVVSPCAA